MGTQKEARGGQRGSGEKGYCTESGGECVPRGWHGEGFPKVRLGVNWAAESKTPLEH